MDFLKEILGEKLFNQFKTAVEAYNGKPENKEKQVNIANLGNGDYVGKGKYESLYAEKENLEGQIKTLNTTIKDLKESNADNEELQNTIQTLQTDLKNQQTANANMIKTYAVKEQLSKAGVLDPDYLIYKTGGIDKFTFDKENQPVGVEQMLKPYREDKTMAYLFKQERQKPIYNPQGGGAGGTVNPFAKETYNLTKQGELLKNNPEQAKVMAAAAGVTI